MSTIATRAAAIVSPSTRQFVRHYAEMLVAMFDGMIVLGMPAVAALNAAGMTRTELRIDYPTLLLFGMGVVMTVPMVASMALPRAHLAAVAGDGGVDDPAHARRPRAAVERRSRGHR
jgi:hypothetical protein